MSPALKSAARSPSSDRQGSETWGIIVHTPESPKRASVVKAPTSPPPRVSLGQKKTSALEQLSRDDFEAASEAKTKPATNEECQQGIQNATVCVPLMRNAMAAGAALGDKPQASVEEHVAGKSWSNKRGPTSDGDEAEVELTIEPQEAHWSSEGDVSRSFPENLKSSADESSPGTPRRRSSNNIGHSPQPSTSMTMDDRLHRRVSTRRSAVAAKTASFNLDQFDKTDPMVARRKSAPDFLDPTRNDVRRPSHIGRHGKSSEPHDCDVIRSPSSRSISSVSRVSEIETGRRNF